MRFNITKHCKQRYIERILNGLNTSTNIIMTILGDLNSSKDITDKVYTECPRYILYLHEKYKEAGQRIMLYNNIIFITKKRTGTESLFDVYTCFNKSENWLLTFKQSVLSREEIYIKISAIKKLNRANK